MTDCRCNMIYLVSNISALVSCSWRSFNRRQPHPQEALDRRRSGRLKQAISWTQLRTDTRRTMWVRCVIDARRMWWMLTVCSDDLVDCWSVNVTAGSHPRFRNCLRIQSVFACWIIFPLDLFEGLFLYSCWFLVYNNYSCLHNSQ